MTERLEEELMDEIFYEDAEGAAEIFEERDGFEEEYCDAFEEAELEAFTEAELEAEEEWEEGEEYCFKDKFEEEGFEKFEDYDEGYDKITMVDKWRKWRNLFGKDGKKCFTIIGRKGQKIKKCITNKNYQLVKSIWEISAEIGRKTVYQVRQQIVHYRQIFNWLQAMEKKALGKYYPQYFGYVKWIWRKRDRRAFHKLLSAEILVERERFISGYYGKGADIVNLTHICAKLLEQISKDLLKTGDEKVYYAILNAPRTITVYAMNQKHSLIWYTCLLNKLSSKKMALPKGTQSFLEQDDIRKKTIAKTVMYFLFKYGSARDMANDYKIRKNYLKLFLSSGLGLSADYTGFKKYLRQAVSIYRFYKRNFIGSENEKLFKLYAKQLINKDYIFAFNRANYKFENPVILKYPVLVSLWKRHGRQLTPVNEVQNLWYYDLNLLKKMKALLQKSGVEMRTKPFVRQVLVHKWYSTDYMEELLKKWLKGGNIIKNNGRYMNSYNLLMTKGGNPLACDPYRGTKYGKGKCVVSLLDNTIEKMVQSSLVETDPDKRIKHFVKAIKAEGKSICQAFHDIKYGQKGRSGNINTAYASIKTWLADQQDTPDTVSNIMKNNCRRVSLVP